jgi:hypothetical protein
MQCNRDNVLQEEDFVHWFQVDFDITFRYKKLVLNQLATETVSVQRNS